MTSCRHSPRMSKAIFFFFFLYILSNSFSGYTHIYINIWNVTWIIRWLNAVCIGIVIPPPPQTPNQKTTPKHQNKPQRIENRRTSEMWKTGTQIIQWDVIPYRKVCLPHLASLFPILNSKIPVTVPPLCPNWYY